MGSIAIIRAGGLARVARAHGISVIEYDHVRGVEGAWAETDFVVFGSDVDGPVQALQHCYRADRQLGVLLIAPDAQALKRLRDAIRLAPLIGRDVECVIEPDALDKLASGAGRTQARRSSSAKLELVNHELEQMRPVVPRRGEEFAATVFHCAPIGIVTLDEDARVTAMNEAASSLLGISERASVGVPLDIESIGGTPELMESWPKGVGAEPLDVTLSHLDRSLSVRVAHLGAKGTGGWLVLLHDVTDQERAAKLREEAARRAEEANRHKDEFIAMVSHELRTPLAAIVGWARLLRSRSVPEGSLAHAHEVIERNASAQERLIEDLLDVSRILSGKMKLAVTNLDLRALVLEVVDSFRLAASAKRVTLASEVALDVPGVRGDPDRLRQVVANLISNAVKFTPNGAAVRVFAELVANSQVELRVEDEGIGIDTATLPFIFDPFRQAEAGTARRYGGLGLGLAIVRWVVELHGGTVEARSEGRGKGTTVAIRIPAASVDTSMVAQQTARTSPSSAAASVRSGELTGRRILLVDDDVDGRDLVVMILEGAGADVAQCGSAQDARRLLANDVFDVIVSDIAMPDEDGHDLLMSIRRNGDLTPALALTANAREVDRRRALEAGFDDYAQKPIDPPTLITSVKSLALRR